MRCAVLVAGPDQERQAGRRCDRQRRRPGDVCRCVALLPDRAECAAGQTADRDGSGEPTPKEDADAGGNLVGSVLCNLATHVDDPAQRIQTISASMDGNKKVLSELPQLQVLALSALNMAPLTLAGVPGFLSAVPPPFNIVISNVPGPVDPLYYGTARLDGSYPLSNIPDGQALNITLVNNAGNLDFGLVGCRRSVPHLQRLLAHLESSLKDLEQAVGI